VRRENLRAERGMASLSLSFETEHIIKSPCLIHFFKRLWFLVPFFSLLLSIIAFIPLFFSSQQKNNSMNQDLTSSSFIVHSSVGVLCCCFQLFLHPFFHQTIPKFNYFQLPQRLFLFSITFPALILYAAHLREKISSSLSSLPSFSSTTL
jgi:hypothetical protein